VRVLTWCCLWVIAFSVGLALCDPAFAQEQAKAPGTSPEKAKAPAPQKTPPPEVVKTPVAGPENAKTPSTSQNETRATDRQMKAQAHYELGLMYHERVFESLDQAVAEYEKAVQLKPDYAEAHFNLGLSYNTKAKLGTDDKMLYRKALDEYTLYLKHSPQGEWADKAKKNIRAIQERLAPVPSRAKGR